MVLLAIKILNFSSGAHHGAVAFTVILALHINYINYSVPALLHVRSYLDHPNKFGTLWIQFQKGTSASLRCASRRYFWHACMNSLRLEE